MNDTENKCFKPTTYEDLLIENTKIVADNAALKAKIVELEEELRGIAMYGLSDS